MGNKGLIAALPVGFSQVIIALSHYTGLVLTDVQIYVRIFSLRLLVGAEVSIQKVSNGQKGYKLVPMAC